MLIWSSIPMAVHEIQCPLCVGTARVELEPEFGIFRVEGFRKRPRRFSILRRRPESSHGEKLFLEREKQARISTRCDEKHFLRVLAAPYYYIPNENCLYDPERIPPIQCPHCRFQYGTHADFVYEADTRDGESVHVLRSVSKQPKPGYEEVAAMTRQSCTSNDRVTLRKDCPNCRKLSYFNYRTLSVDPEVNFSGTVEVQSGYER